jgi:hypothetical protein
MIQPFFDDGDNQVGGNGNQDPGRGLSIIFQSSVRVLYTKLLLDTLEKDIHLPSLLVWLGNGDSG